MPSSSTAWPASISCTRRQAPPTLLPGTIRGLYFADLLRLVAFQHDVAELLQFSGACSRPGERRPEGSGAQAVDTTDHAPAPVETRRRGTAACAPGPDAPASRSADRRTPGSRRCRQSPSRTPASIVNRNRLIDVAQQIGANKRSRSLLDRESNESSAQATLAADPATAYAASRRRAPPGRWPVSCRQDSVATDERTRRQRARYAGICEQFVQLARGGSALASRRARPARTPVQPAGRHDRLSAAAGTAPRSGGARNSCRY